MNKKGFTLIEGLVTMGLLSVMTLVFIGGVHSLKNAFKSTQLISSTDKQVQDIAENIKAGLENYQINFDFDSDANSQLDISNLPMAWDEKKVGSRADCPNCAGSYGYYIQPLEEFRGLYRVTLRMTHKTWVAAGESYRDYVFVVGVK